MREILSITKALADENRLRALYALQSGELCLCQIIELLRLAPSTVSKHMSILRQARLIEGRKEGRWIYYRLMGPEKPLEVQRALDWICGALLKTKRIQEDGRRLKKILRIDREELCKRHRCPDPSDREIRHFRRKANGIRPISGPRTLAKQRKTS
jgi:DNA-binding transcriptional ArsR family regulator